MLESNLPVLLKQLRLPTIAQRFEMLSEQAQKAHWSYTQYLNELAQLEVDVRSQNRIQRLTYESKLPAGKTLDRIDFALSPRVNAGQIQALSENKQWLDEAENLIIFGPSGVGKTHIASAIGYRLIEQGARVLFKSTSLLVQQLQRSRASYELTDALDKLNRYDLLILDDIGYVKKDEGETSVLFELIAHRYESGSILITSNQAFSEWDQIFPDNMVAVAAIDRLVHHARIIKIEGESYRKANASVQKINNEEVVTNMAG